MSERAKKAAFVYREAPADRTTVLKTHQKATEEARSTERATRDGGEREKGAKKVGGTLSDGQEDRS